VFLGGDMGLTEFGKAIRKARLDLGETLMTMAQQLNVSPAYLSGLETGRKNISNEWVKKLNTFFTSKNFEVPLLAELAELSNKLVSIDGLDSKHQMLTARFARSSFDAETLDKIAKLIEAVETKERV
jgi:transcriptional regulator with XRE-family HTH domain